jgi:hypothetical protein
MEGPMVADCLGALIVAAGATGAVLGGAATGAGAGVRAGSAWGLTVFGSSFRLFHTLSFPSSESECSA